MRRLTNVERVIVDYCEQEFLANGVLPDSKAIYAFLTDHHAKLRREPDWPESPVAIAVSLAQEGSDEDYSVSIALKNRGIDPNDQIPGRGLSSQQLAAINVLMDFADKRSTKAKLNELGISTTQYSAWCRNPQFQAYSRQRAENLLGDHSQTAHIALMQNIERGDLNSIKLYYEMIGRWSSKSAGEVNIEFLMIRILETLQRHVHDPNTLMLIAADLGELTGAGQPKSLNPVTVAIEPPVAKQPDWVL
jgi:hypothetical protein